MQTVSNEEQNKNREFAFPTESETASYWLNALVDSADDAIIGKTLDGIITSWNRGAERIFGYKANEVVGKPVLLLIPPDLQNEEREILARIRRGERVERYETVCLRKDGSPINISLTVSPIKTPDGQIIGASKIAADITELKQAEALRRESENQLRLIADALPVLISYVDCDECYRFVNRSYKEWFKTETENLNGKTVREVIGEAAYQAVKPNIERVLAGEEFTFERLMPYLGGERFIRVNYIPDRDAETKQIKGFFALVQDVSESKRAEARLRESEVKFSKAFNASPLALTISSLVTGKLIEVNDTFVNVTGFSREEAIGRTTVELGLWAKLLDREEEMETVRRTGQIRDAEFLFRGKDGKEIYGLLSAEEIEINNESYALTVIQNITKRKQAEEKLRQSDARLRLAIEISQTSTFEIDLQTDRVETDQSGREIYGWKPDEPLTFSQVQTHFHPDDREPVRQAVEAALAPDGAGEFEVEQRIIRTDGETRWIRVRGRAFFEGEAEEKHPVRILGTYIDITTRKSEELDRQFLLELGEKIRYGDFNAARLLDDAAETTCRHLGAGRCLFIEIKESDDLGIIRHEYFKPGMPPIAGEYRISDYSPQTLEDIKNGHIIVNRDAERDPRTAEFYRKTYEPYGEKSYISIPLFTDGRWAAIFWISDDRTRNWTEREIAFASTVGERAWLAVEKLRADEERENLLRRERSARSEAEEASRLKDEFLATVSHELRTPLNAILGWSQMLAANKLGENETARAVQTIYRNARSQAQLIEDILDVSRIITGKLRIEPSPIALAPVVQAAVESLRPALEAKHIRLQMRLDFERRMVNADAGRWQQVVWNLLSNAIKFTPAGGQITIELETGENETKIIVSDTGQGIEPEFLPYVFDRFRQADGSPTRNHGGLGLGLSIVRHIVDLHGGTVAAASEGENSGTTFTVSLPLAEIGQKQSKETVEAKETTSASVQANGVSGQIEGLRILLVDDEPDTLELLASFLDKNKAETKAVSSVAAALETLQNWRPDVIVSDIAMPEEDGYSLIKKLRALPPEAGGTIPVVALTAYVGIKERTKVLSNGFQMYVPKPVEPTELLGALANFVREQK